MNSIALRKYRMLSIFSLIILLPASGMLWAVADSQALQGLSILVTILSVIAVLAEEAVSTAVDEEVVRLQDEVTRRGERIGDLEEAMREEGRILARLEDQNSTLSAELIAVTAHNEAA